MTTVYAVNRGEYSDYQIVGIFSTEEKARTFMAAFPSHEWNDIEEYELDVGTKEIDRGLTYWRVRMYRDGDILSVEKCVDGVYGNFPVAWFTSGYWRPPKPWTNFYVWARDQKHAVKIANEHRIAALAAEDLRGDRP